MNASDQGSTILPPLEDDRDRAPFELARGGRRKDEAIERCAAPLVAPAAILAPTRGGCGMSRHPQLSPAEWAALRDRVRARDHFACVYCGGPAKLLDFIVRAGPAREDNLVSACDRCIAFGKQARFRSVGEKRAWVLGRIAQIARLTQPAPVPIPAPPPPPPPVPREQPAGIPDDEWRVFREWRIARVPSAQIRDRYRLGYDELARLEARVLDAHRGVA